MQTSGASRRDIAKPYLELEERNWERSKAINFFFMWGEGLLCFARNDVLILCWSKRLAQEFRAFQSISPWQFNRLGKADPYPRDEVRLLRPRMQRDRRGAERQFASAGGGSKGFAQLSGPPAQRSHVPPDPPWPPRSHSPGCLAGA